MNLGAVRGVARWGWRRPSWMGGTPNLSRRAVPDGVFLDRALCGGKEASLPSVVVGPRALAPLARADSDLREVVILCVGYEKVRRFVVSSRD